jgi:arginine/lysine/ornithine decarboxylase
MTRLSPRRAAGDAIPYSAAKHSATPLLTSLQHFVSRRQAPFYSPGHKGGRSLDPWFRANIAELDLNNLPDTDTLHCPTGPILEAERLIADAWGVAQSFMLVQGSTVGNLAMALSALRPGDRVLVQRNAHKSVVAGLIQSGAHPVWLPPRWDETFGVAHGVDATVLEARLAEAPTRAVWLLHPTYYGSVADIECLAALCRRYGALLLVDGAHSPHFAFHADLPTPAEHAGATAVVQSVHKIISGLSQAAILHIDPHDLPSEAVRRALQLVQTTSPHFAIMASIDLARREMATEGHTLLQRTLDLARRARQELSAIPGISVLGTEHATGPASGFYALDQTKLLIGVGELGIDGREILTTLNRDYGVQPELAGAEHILCIVTLGNTEADIDRLVAAIRQIASRVHIRRRAASDSALLSDLLTHPPQVSLTPREAYFAPDETVSFERAIGRIAAEAITPYPPGIPVVMPGECLTPDVAALLAALRTAGTPISAGDPSLSTIKVVL